MQIEVEGTDFSIPTLEKLVNTLSPIERNFMYSYTTDTPPSDTPYSEQKSAVPVKSKFARFKIAQEIFGVAENAAAYRSSVGIAEFVPGIKGLIGLSVGIALLATGSILGGALFLSIGIIGVLVTGVFLGISASRQSKARLDSDKTDLNYEPTNGGLSQLMKASQYENDPYAVDLTQESTDIEPKSVGSSLFSPRTRKIDPENAPQDLQPKAAPRI